MTNEPRRHDIASAATAGGGGPPRGPGPSGPTPYRVVARPTKGRLINAPIELMGTVLADPGPGAMVVVGESGTASTGDGGVAIAGTAGSASALRDGLAYVQSGTARCDQPSGIAIVRNGGTAIAADFLAAAYAGGTAQMQGAGIAIAINKPGATSLDATAQASPNGLIILGYFVDSAEGPIPKYVVLQVDGVMIKGNTPYKLENSPFVHPIEA